MACFSRQVSRKRMVERIGAELLERSYRSGRHEAVDQHWNARVPRGERGSEDCG
jgi:hypothetical protein